MIDKKKKSISIEKVLKDIPKEKVDIYGQPKKKGGKVF